MTLLQYDADDKETTVEAEEVKRVYTVQLLKRITGVSSSKHTVVKDADGGTMATVTATTPEAGGKKSDAPITGNFAVECTDKNGKKWKTSEFGYNTSAIWIEWHMVIKIPFLVDKIEVQDKLTCDYYETCRDFVIKFRDLHADPKQCEIKSGETTPLTYNTGGALKSTTLHAYGKNLMFDPVPLEMLRTARAMPQVTVKVHDGKRFIDALCPKFTCDYKYIASVGEVTA